MTLGSKALPALAAGALLAFGASGCASWHGDAMHETHASAPMDSGHRGGYMAAIDDQTTTDVLQAFRADHALDARGIAVKVMKGVVELSGTVRSDADRARAVQIARGVGGVVDVRDNLRASG